MPHALARASIEWNGMDQVFVVGQIVQSIFEADRPTLQIKANRAIA